MSSMIYLSIERKIQGLISEGCGSYVSIDSKHQIDHVDEIFVLQFDHSLSRKHSATHHPIGFYEPIDESFPSLNAAFSENKESSAVSNFYRASSNGRIGKFYTIELQGAHLPNILTHYLYSITHVGTYLLNILTYYPHSVTRAGNQLEDVIVLNYENITWKHHTASTGSCSC